MINQEPTSDVTEYLYLGPPKTEQTLWPRHCVQESWGAELHKDLKVGIYLLEGIYENDQFGTSLVKSMKMEYKWLTRCNFNRVKLNENLLREGIICFINLRP